MASVEASVILVHMNSGGVRDSDGVDTSWYRISKIDEEDLECIVRAVRAREPKIDRPAGSVQNADSPNSLHFLVEHYLSKVTLYDLKLTNYLVTKLKV